MHNFKRYFCFYFWIIIAGLISSVNAVANTVTPCSKIMEQKFCDKIGQMLIIGFGGLNQNNNGDISWNDQNGTTFNPNSLIAQHIANNHIGGIILFLNPLRNKKTGVFIRDRNVQHPEQVAKLNNDLQNYNHKIRQKQHLEPLPLFISVDQEGGRIDRLPAQLGFISTNLPHQAFGAKEEMFWYQPNQKNKALKETYTYAQNLAKELKATHFNLNFAPVVDININPTNPIIGGLGRSFSHNPQIVVDQAREFIKAFKEQRLIPVLKHFPGHGSSGQDTHLGLVDVTDSYQKDKELFPYYALIKDGVPQMIMTTHVINGQIDRSQCKAGEKTDHRTWCPGTMSYRTLTGLLRNEMGFNGIIISDDFTMGAIADEYSLDESLQKALNAGVNMIILSNNTSDKTDLVINTIAQLVKDGRVHRSRIEDSYNRIVALKKQL